MTSNFRLLSLFSPHIHLRTSLEYVHEHENKVGGDSWNKQAVPSYDAGGAEDGGLHVEWFSGQLRKCRIS